MHLSKQRLEGIFSLARSMRDHCRPLVMHTQQRLTLAPPRVGIREDERERAQDVIEVGAQQSISNSWPACSIIRRKVELADNTKQS
jgi:hypothetical protein